MNLRAAALLPLLLGACATKGGVEIVEGGSRVDRQMLFPETRPGAGNALQVEAYTVSSQERFRWPLALVDALPQLPADSPRRMLPPTTVCVRIVVSEEGQVDRVDGLDDRDECHAGIAVENADLLQAVRAAVMQWRYRPAAICTYAVDVNSLADTYECKGAEVIRSVPVSLMYAFTFEVREGKTRVISGSR